MPDRELPVLESCDGCGLCCHTVSLPPFRIDFEMNEPEHRGVPEILRDEFLLLWERRFEIEDDFCLWFDPELLKCRYYDLRPQACRDFELNSSSCQAVRREKQAK